MQPAASREIVRGTQHTGCKRQSVPPGPIVHTFGGGPLGNDGSCTLHIASHPSLVLGAGRRANVGGADVGMCLVSEASHRGADSHTPPNRTDRKQNAWMPCVFPFAEIVGINERQMPAVTIKLRLPWATSHYHRHAPRMLLEYPQVSCQPLAICRCRI